MTTATQLIKFLQTIPPETEIEVLTEKQSAWSSYTEFTPLDLNMATSDNAYLLDLRKAKQYPGRRLNPSIGRIFLQLGSK